MKERSAAGNAWPELPFEEWKETFATLHMWLQIVGKIRLVQTPWTNHSWHTTFYVTTRGLTTSPIPCQGETFSIDFDFVNHQLSIETSTGGTEALALEPISVSSFYAGVFERLESLGLDIRINSTPNEVADPVPFDRDERHASYDRKYAHRFWRALAQSDRVFRQFRARFLGKCSPVHFFWGAPDLAVTRFSGRTAPQHPGGIPNLPDAVSREAYSHEVSSCGFWPGSEALPHPGFYSYAYPEPSGFAEARVGPQEAFYSTDLNEFLLPYDAVRQSSSPDDTLLEFLQTTYEAAADLAGWDRRALERGSGFFDAA